MEVSTEGSTVINLNMSLGLVMTSLYLFLLPTALMSGKSLLPGSQRSLTTNPGRSKR